MGARTTGIDASASNIKIASLHASADPRLSNSSATATGSLTYRNMAAENLLKESKKYDAVCSLEVLEHVDNPRVFLQTLGELVKVSDFRNLAFSFYLQ
jgi:polyprenyldihydroxybenzoate methyltransferase / 3-demethylubiquinol 3-O-methyltransferase